MKKSRMTGGKAAANTFRRATGGLLTPINSATRKSLTPLLAAAKRTAPVDQGALKASLAVKKDGRSAKNRPRYVVGPRADYVGPDGARPVKYAHITEFGKADGSVKGSRWLTRAFEATKDEVLARLGALVGPEIEKHVAKKAVKK